MEENTERKTVNSSSDANRQTLPSGGKGYKISLFDPALDQFSRNSSASFLPRGDHEERKRPSVLSAFRRREQDFSFVLT